MIRLVEKHEPGATELAARIERERRLVYEHHLFEFFEDLKRRFPVRILDPRLREINLPPPPVPPAS
jgi:hypothetical protein